MTALAQRLKYKFFSGAPHPYRIFENQIHARLTPDSTVLDAGCGRTAPVLATYRGRSKRLIGVDVVDFAKHNDGIELYQCDLSRIPIDADSVDVVMARSVMEQVVDPAA